MRRILTAAVGVPLALWGLFRLPTAPFFVAVLAIFLLAADEYRRLLSRQAAGAPSWLVLPLTAVVAIALAPWLDVGEPAGEAPGLVALLTVGLGIAVVLLRTPVEQTVTAVGGIAFGALLLGLPVAALSDLQARSPWLLFLLLAIVWLGDTAAYYLGTRFGRHKLAPVVSPNKSWEGAAAAALVSIASAAAWSQWQWGRLDAVLIALALLTSVGAQMGDLVESSLKRGAGVKDSGTLLPGHGGLLDRLDALTFAAPIWWLALDLLDRLPEMR